MLRNELDVSIINVDLLVSLPDDVDTIPPSFGGFFDIAIVINDACATSDDMWL